MIQTSEWDARAVIAYAQIHHKKKFNKMFKKVQKWSENDINNFLDNKTFSLNSKVPAHIVRKNTLFKSALVASTIVNKNFPDIRNVHGQLLKNVNLLTYSFPCQGLSIANMGRDKGISKSSNSTSNLIWEIQRILWEAQKAKIKLPKYLLMENVKNLILKNHIDEYKKWKTFLKSLGYITYTIVLNGINHCSLQKRKRVFGISILNASKKLDDEEAFKLLFKQKYGSCKLTKQQRKSKYFNILKSSSSFPEEILEAIPNNTKSRKKMAKENPDLTNRVWKKGEEFTFNTLTTKQDRHPNIGMLKVSQNSHQKLGKRFITCREGYKIMGFSTTDFNNVKTMYTKGILTKESLYRQAGNSIIVSILENIFQFISDYERGIYD